MNLNNYIYFLKNEFNFFLKTIYWIFINMSDISKELKSIQKQLNEIRDILNKQSNDQKIERELLHEANQRISYLSTKADLFENNPVRKVVTSTGEKKTKKLPINKYFELTYVDNKDKFIEIYGHIFPDMDKILEENKDKINKTKGDKLTAEAKTLYSILIQKNNDKKIRDKFKKLMEIELEKKECVEYEEIKEE